MTKVRTALEKEIEEDNSVGECGGQNRGGKEKEEDNSEIVTHARIVSIVWKRGAPALVLRVTQHQWDADDANNVTVLVCCTRQF